ncbi:YibE/F family protein [Nocardioides jiangxiensis]|uniref:YibE/F family protein n=1 Tax=Nocardioides jiangxiensis TaxID=3064524 RepID=A0ABT9AXQ9_9ACTN|nr:YibE/F family protein [Nocardioides sp. WY-20]MDO7867157.1 YibE/F family protein [Nocardioides sp. WY-20]
MAHTHGHSHAHSHGHSHGHDAAAFADVRTAATPRRALFAFLVLAAIATVVGLVQLWPDGHRPHAQYAATGVTYPSATVVDAHRPCPVIDPNADPADAPTMPQGCDGLTVKLADGTKVDVQAEPGATRSGLRAGDRVTLAKVPTPDGTTVYSYFGTQRSVPVGLLLAAFVLVVLLVARWRGLMALLGLGIAVLVVGFWMVPALLEGHAPVPVALTASATIMFVVLYAAHGLSVRTSTALAGTFVGLGVTALLGLQAVGWSRLSGLGAEASDPLRTYAGDLDFRALMVAAIVVAGLGVLNDVTITQASAVWELRAASATMTRREIYTSAMRIGRDHIASAIYTIVFVYAGTALTTLLFVALYDRTLLDMLLTEQFAEECVMTLASSIGLVLAMPATTVIAALTVSGPRTQGRRRAAW